MFIVAALVFNWLKIVILKHELGEYTRVCSLMLKHWFNRELKSILLKQEERKGKS